MSTQAEVFTKDLERFHSEQKHYLDASGNFLGYDATRGVRAAPLPVEKQLFFDNKTYFKGSGTAVNDPSCQMSDPTLEGGKPVGLSNVNFGHITNSHEFGGTMLQDLEWTDASSNQGLGSKRVLRVGRGVLRCNDLFTTPNIGFYMNTEQILMEGELTAPLVEAQDEQGAEGETEWFCKGCSKFFATKASLKRHHERKKSCKELSEKRAIDLSGSLLPDKPYIVEWVDQLLTKAIAGDSDKPYCKHCEIEFANKTNLNKHLSKSVACDKLAKQEFLKLLTN